MTIADVKFQIKETSAKQVVQDALARAQSDGHHALLALTEQRALERADEIDKKLSNGHEAGELAGVPFIAKDNMLVYGAPTTAAAKILENFEAPFQAESIERLEAAGAICIGKANLDAFAHGSSTENSAFGPTTNPHDETRVAGGSSGGSAASVALDIVPFALGTDTGGSIRQPASFCGIVGFKPTYGAISRYGVVAMASSTDVIGILTNTAQDAETVMKIVAGVDTKDSTTVAVDFTKKKTVKKIGVIKDWLGEGLDESVRIGLGQEVAKLKQAGYEVEEVSMPTLKHGLAVYYVITPAEITSNLARYDGIRYGSRAGTVRSLSEVYEKSRSEGFMPENERRIMIGNFVLSSGYYDAYFKKAAKVRTLIVEEFNTAFSNYDLLIGPTTPTPAFKLGENIDDPLKMYLADQMTVLANLAGIPAVSLPIKTTGLPIGLQVLGPRGFDATVLSFAAQHVGELA